MMDGHPVNLLLKKSLGHVNYSAVHQVSPRYKNPTIHYQTKSSLLTINLLRFKPWSVQLNTTVMYSQELKKDYHENLL